MEPLPVALKIHVEVELDGKPLRITAQVEGEGETARHAAAELASAVAAVISQTTPHTPGPITQAASVDPVSETTASLSQSSEELTKPLAERAPVSTKPVPSPMTQWIGRNRARINLSAGGLLLVLAVFIPIIVPPGQRSDVLIMTILFGITGTLLLATAMLPARNRNVAEKPAPSVVRQAPLRSASLSRTHPQSQAKVNPLKAWWGIILGAAFVLAGFIAPFILGATTADERFIIMLGFAPVVVVGFFMIAIFGRGLFKFPQSSAGTTEAAPKPAGGATTVNVKRAPVTRVPQNWEYKAIVPAAIIGLLIVMVAVVALVIFATVSSAVR